MSATQQLTDGEIFYIIENGVRLTGMPAWTGVDRADENDGWNLVHFIRHLKDVAPTELEQMESPKRLDERHESTSTHHRQ